MPALTNLTVSVAMNHLVCKKNNNKRTVGQLFRQRVLVPYLIETGTDTLISV